MKSKLREQTRRQWADGPKQGEETWPRRPYVEPAAWSDRMLATLHHGVRGGKWFSLWDKVCAPKNLEAAWTKVRANRGSAGIDRQSVWQFERQAERYLRELHEELLSGEYRPNRIARRWIPKGGSKEKRPLGIPTVRDRVVQTALRNVLEPIWEEREFEDESFGFRPGRGCKDALREVQHLLNEGYVWVVDADIRSYFDSIDPQLLMGEIEKKVSDGAVLKLLKQFLQQEVVEGLRDWTPTRGTPQGAVISPLLANIFLHPVDQVLIASGFKLVRYADDLVLMCRTEEEARRALSVLEGALLARDLQLHPEKTQIVDAREHGGFDFLGYHFERGYRWPREKSVKALKDRVRSKTRRTDGRSLSSIIADLNSLLRGWFEYFKHSGVRVFHSLDGWIRMRLRSILRRRERRRGVGRGKDHFRWPKSFFERCGLFSLEAARASFGKSR